METEEITTHNDAQATERKPIKRQAREAGVDAPEPADGDTMFEQLKNDIERLVKQNHEAVMTVAKQNHDKIAATLSATLSTIRQDNTRFARVDAKFEGNTNALESRQTRIDALENSKSSSSPGSRKGKEQNSPCRSHRFHQIVH